MKKRKLLRCALFFLCLLMSAQTALAASNIQRERDVSLTIQYRYDGEAVSGIPFSVYKVAEVSEVNAVFTPNEDFAGYPVQLNDLDAAMWADLAQTLSGYAALDGISPLSSGVTDKNGMLVFSSQPGADMKPGLYLVVSPATTAGGYTYTTQPALICLPNRNEDYSWNYDAVMRPKCSRRALPHSPSRVIRKVLKVWDDEKNENSRPEEITVHLLRDGAIYDTQILSAQNQWRFTWRDLPDVYDWQVVEEPVDGYRTLVSREGVTFVVNNSYVPDEPPPGEPPPDEPPPSEPPPDEPPKLPQTGTTWYLVPILASVGLLLLLIGLLRRRSER